MIRSICKRLLVCIVCLMLLAGVTLAETDFTPSADADPAELMEEAMEVYGWFALCPLDVDPYMPSADGNLYRVLDSRLNTPEAMRAVLESYFSDEICDQLMTSGVYVAEDGWLYTGMEYREADPTIAAVEYYLTEQTDSQQWYTAAVYYSTEEGEITSIDEYTYLRELIGDRWVFTDFWFFR